MLSHHNNNHRVALTELYPDIKLDKEKFLRWAHPDIRRAFFNNFAKVKGFDPLVAENWYLITRSELLKHKVRER